MGYRVGEVKIIKGSELGAVVTDNFILVPLNKGLEPMKGNRGEDIGIRGDYEKGEKFSVVFKAKRVL